MSTGEEDHNYYSQGRRRSQLPDYNLDRQPRSHSHSHRPGHPLSATAADALPSLPASYFRQSQQYARRPLVTTKLDDHASSSNAASYLHNAAEADSLPDDPHEFYRQYRDSFRRESGSVYGGIGATHAEQQEEEMLSAARSSPRPMGLGGRGNGHGLSGAARWENRVDSRSPLSERGDASERTASRGRRQSSLQALVNKFNQTPDEVPPLPNASQSTSTSENPSPSSATGPPKSFKTRVSSDLPRSKQASGSRDRRPVPDSSSTRTPTKSSESRRNNRGAAGGDAASSTRTPRNARRSSPPTRAGTAVFSHSMTDIGPASQSSRKPLFGEIVAPGSAASDLGYGIPGPRRRRGSEGSSNMHYPNSMFKDDSEASPRYVSPSSPTAWYMGVTPSLEGIDLDKPLPAKQPGSHGRSRSDIVSGGFAMPGLLSSHGQNIMIMSPPQEQHSSDSSPTQSKRPGHSRIPVSTGRLSTTSDSGDSYHDARNDSGVAHAFVGRKTQVKPPTNLPTPVHPTTPERSSRSTTPRKSPRHRNHSPRQPSPRLPAYISEPPPVKSPPLRSSRPRQPVSSATTSASRARAAANVTGQKARSRDRGGKNLPELGGVDFAARRERIQRAFTTKVKEKEIETERKRMSLIHDAQMQQALKEKMLAQGGQQPSTLRQEQSYDDLGGKDEEAFSARPRREQHGQATSRPATGAVEEGSTLGPVPEDSPTLGTAAVFLEPAKYQDHDGSSDADPGSAVTSGTAETFFENEPQESSNLTETQGGTTKELPSLPSFLGNAKLTSPNLRLGAAFFDPDRGEGESIQIHLQEARAGERGGMVDSNLPGRDGSQAADGVLATDSRWSMSSLTSSDADSATKSQGSPPLDRIAARSPPSRTADPSISTSGSTITQGPWSPESSSSFTSAPSTHDSDPYNMITRVLSSFHDPSLMSAESLKNLQQRLFEQAPTMATKGTLSPQAVTQLYIQDVVRNRSKDPGALLEPPQALDSNGIARSDSPCVPPLALKISTKAAHDFHALDGRAAEAEGRPEAFDPNELDAPVVPNLQRASASLTNPDDWANTSPSMLDWIHHQAMDTPVEEKSHAFFPTPKLKSLEPYASGRPAYDSPVLPDIEPTGGLGIDITVDSPYDVSAEPPKSRPHPPAPADSFSSASRPYGAWKNDASSTGLRSQSPGFSGKFSSKPAVPSKSPSPDFLGRNNVEDVRLQSFQAPRTDAEYNRQPSLDTSSMAESAGRSSLSPEDQKRLKRRRHILKEIVDTESSFGQDMTVVVDIYKGTSNVILNSPEDVKVLFGNAAEIVQFSTGFLDSLKHASKSVYVLPKSKRWKTKRDSNATNGSATTDDQASVAGMDLSDEEKDRMTSIGSAFEGQLVQMERVYTEYLKNHDAANQKLAHLQKSEKVKIWLKECRAYAHDLTSAWDLDSLLVKPVQRILKYPLLLKELLECTPENHPDFLALDTSAREMIGVSVRINEAKKRADLVEKANGTSTNKAKRKDTEGRLLLPKAFGRRTEKFKQQVGMSDTVHDHAYNAVSNKFGSHFFQLQVVMRDVEMYVMDSQIWVNKFNDFVLAMEAYMDVGQTCYPEIESKWRRFRLSIREIQMTALTDHTNAVRKHVIEPMTTLLKLHDGPQRLMDKRKKRVMDYAKFKAIRDRGEKPDKKTTEQGEQFKAINETLKDELPKLFSLTGKLVEACLHNFVQLQLQWLSVWKSKLRQAIESHEIPPSFAAIFDQFSGDFKYTEAQVLSLGLCNGSLLADSANFVHFVSSDRNTLAGSTLNDDSSSRRPSVATEHSRSRATSNCTADQDRLRGFSTSSGISPMLPSPDFGRPSDGFGLSGHLNSPNPYSSQTHPPTGRRIRASSAVSARSPISPEASPAAYRGYSVSGASGSYRPGTSSGRDQGYPRVPSHEDGRGGGDRLHPDGDPRDLARYAGSRDNTLPTHRNSGIFSSAMPMSDSPRTGSPSGETPTEFNVLFLAASVYEFNIDRARREAGYPYLTYVAGEIFDVIGEKGELWLAKNQDDSTNQVGWIWNKHFAKLAS